MYFEILQVIFYVINPWRRNNKEQIAWRQSWMLNVIVVSTKEHQIQLVKSHQGCSFYVDDAVHHGSF